ncbi:MAG: hypothetical protein II970_08975 [Paludibacteraceae bacterium]|nr:hypothetical protein [Paludibacteraceae bacterium]
MKKLILFMSLCLGIVTQLNEAYAATHTITVTASPSDKGSVRGGGSYEEGTTVYLVAVPVNGYFFQQWSDGNTSNPRQITVGTDPDSYTAEFGSADFEYHFDWASDVNASNSGRVMTGSYSNRTFYINRVSIWKDYVTNNAVGYPGINIDMCAGAEGSTSSSSYNYGNGKYFANPGSYVTIQDYCPNNLFVSNSDAGRIIGCSHKVCVNNSAQSFECYTKLYLSASEEYQIERGSKIYFAPQSTAGYPFIRVQGTFGTTSALITIGTAPVYTITLNDQGATTSGTASVTVTFGESTNLLTPITKPKKTGHRFMGYSGRSGNTSDGFRVIDKDGYFMPNKRAQTPSSSSAYVTSESMQWIASADVTLYAVWEEGEEEEETPTYDVAATVSPVGAGTVTGAGTFDEGDDVILTANPANRRYVFSHWTDGGDNAGTDGNLAYTISSLAADHNNVVAVFTEVPVTLADNEETSYYTATASTFTGEMDFQMMRTFYAGMWNTVCFPFDLTASQITASDMRTATFYTLSSVTGDAAEGLDFNVSEVTALSARTPYLMQVTGANIVEPVFRSVTLDGSAFTNNTSGTNVGDTKFFGTVHPTDLEIGENSGFLFLGQNNALYWPNVANKIRAFRAYFYSGNSTVQAVHPRARIVVKEQTATDLSGQSAEGSSAVNVRKYMHNGTLVIERDGKRYNAVGQEVE